MYGAPAPFFRLTSRPSEPKMARALNEQRTVQTYHPRGRIPLPHKRAAVPVAPDPSDLAVLDFANIARVNLTAGSSRRWDAHELARVRSS